MATAGQALNALEVGKFTRIDKIIPAGTLEARKLASGAIQFYWRFTHAGKTERQPIGTYDSSAPPKSIAPTARGYSVEAARRKAQEYAAAHHLHRDEGGHSQIKQAKLRAKAAAEDAEKQAAEFTLEKLLDEYCDYLESKGRRSHSDARSIFQLHVKDAFPSKAAAPANQLVMEDFVEMMRRLQEAGKGRTSNKLRSYLRAAYEVARSANSNGAIPKVFKGFGIKHNPVSDTVGDTAANKADKNPLTLEELRAYWGLLKTVPGFKGALLRLHLLTGAQRIEQFVKLRTADIKDGVIVLLDPKGKPGKEARLNPVPLTALAQKELSACKATGEYAFSTTEGKKRIAATTLSNWAKEAVGTTIVDFQAKRLRSSVETLLARAKVPKEVRGRLQSHGVGGVQDANYNAYDYVDDKRDALHVLELWLTTKPEEKLHRGKTASRRPPP